MYFFAQLIGGWREKIQILNRVDCGYNTNYLVMLLWHACNATRLVRMDHRIQDTEKTQSFIGEFQRLAEG